MAYHPCAETRCTLAPAGSVRQGTIVPLEMGGGDLTSFMTNLLVKEFPSGYTKPEAQGIARTIKEQMCYLARYYNQEVG